jgi:SAM-dependent methyltransferase
VNLAEQYKDGANLTARADLHAKYGTAPIAWFDWVAQQVDWPVDGDVLEVGCGTGWLWASVTTPLTLTLTDLSEGMVAIAAERVGARAMVADAQALPFDDASFDVVVANHMLYHVPDRAQAIAEFARVLRPHGVLVAATNGSNQMKELIDVGRLTAAFGRENGAELLRTQFAHVEWRTYEDELRCTDVDDVVAYVRSIDKSDDPDLRDRIAARFVDGVMTITKDTGLFLASNR